MTMMAKILKGDTLNEYDITSVELTCNRTETRLVMYMEHAVPLEMAVVIVIPDAVMPRPFESSHYEQVVRDFAAKTVETIYGTATIVMVQSDGWDIWFRTEKQEPACLFIRPKHVGNYSVPKEVLQWQGFPSRLLKMVNLK